MKLIKYITISAVAVAMLGSCNDLEQPPTNQYTDANFWTPERAEYLVNMAYAQMYDAGKMWRDESLSDNICETRGGNIYDIRKGNALPTLGRFNDEWRNLYGGIKTCHVFLDNVEGQNIEEGVKERLKAQVRFVRAYLYFRLTNFYGDVPFFTKDITLEESHTIGRTARSEIIKFIHEEMEAIIPLLPTKQEAVPGRITKGAAAMLDARAYLYDSDWAKVESICRNFMNGTYGKYALFPSYAGLFQVENEYNEEIILERGYLEKSITWAEDMQDMVTYSVGSRTPDVLPVQSLVDNYMMLSGYSIDEAGTDYDPTDPYKNRDPRMEATIIYDGYEWNKNAANWYYKPFINLDRVVFENGYYQAKHPDAVVTDTYKEDKNGYSRTGYGTRKWFSPQDVLDWNSGLNIIMMRYADVLLMYAEAMNEQGKMTESVWNETIRPIRKRAGFTSAKALNYPTYGDMRETLRKERRSELAIEGLRYYDIVRWKAADKYLNGTVKGAGFTTWTDHYVFNDKRDYLWPVPQDQYNLNPNLGQNPGWTSELSDK
ncbi:MAG: RagB/SusD family nutrient uptake outer membrane protein [Prevotella sp.]|jgi:hypothetical protein